MTTPDNTAYVVDAGALGAYADGDSLMIPTLLSDVVERDRQIALSAVVLAEHLCLTGDPHRRDLMQLFAAHPAVEVAPLLAQEAYTIGDWVATAAPGVPASAAHTALLARTLTAGVVTADPAPYKVLLGADWPVLVL